MPKVKNEVNEVEQEKVQTETEEKEEEQDGGEEVATDDNGENDDNDDDDEANYLSQTTNDDNNDMKVMEKSGLTDEQRREIRKAQRHLYKQIMDTDGSAGDTLETREARILNNELFDSVCYPREAVLDGDNLVAIANKITKQMDKWQQVPRYDADRLVHKLVSKCRSNDSSSSFFDWNALGSEAGVCFNSVPSRVSFLNGPIDVEDEEVAPRRRVERRKRVNHEEETAQEQKPQEQEKEQERNADQLSAIEASMKVLSKTLKKRNQTTYREHKRRLEEAHDGGEIPQQVKKKLKKYGFDIDAINYLFNPQSFTQTVENIFHFSFLIKSAKASIGVRDTEIEVSSSDSSGVVLPGPVVKYAEDTADVPRPRQAILSFTMKDWRDLCKAYGVTKGDLPHRTGSQHQKSRRSIVTSTPQGSTPGSSQQSR